MKEFLINRSINFIKNNNNYDTDKLEEIKYGLESIYILISKSIIIFTCAILLNIFKEMIILLLFYNLLRMFGFGIHASKSWICLTSSLLIFIIVPYICKYIYIPIYIKILLLLIGICTIIMYAPADTHKRPILKVKKRVFYKYTTFIISLIFSYITLKTNNQLLSNLIISSIIIECIMIHPLTYKTANMPYNNFKTYKY